MEIVINLPERAYKEICSGNFDTDGYFKKNLSDAFKNGTVLPKGHGDLIDRNKLLEHEVWGVFGEIGNDMPCVFTDYIETATTIIKADKEVEECK